VIRLGWPRLTKFRNFIPDSGTLLHLKTPPLSETVRIDAGFIAGDEVSSHYDPMIAKLIVRGETRQAALQKMRTALESYEIAGPVTNIEFLKRVCVSPAFVAGEVETGYINKYRDELFKPVLVPSEALAQAAIGLLLQEREKTGALAADKFSSSMLGSNIQDRSWILAERSTNPQVKNEGIKISVSELEKDHLEVKVNDKSFKVTMDPSSKSNKFAVYYPHTRLETTLIRDEDRITMWQQGQLYRFLLVSPTWLEKAMGVKDVANSVLAPMPCKVLRVDVKEGDQVKKDQVIAVIESMKMETVIRSPINGTISRVVHGPGVSSTCLHDDYTTLY
jgi:3-methylcrotonyl-CoA carboxylase alpha subunit